MDNRLLSVASSKPTTKSNYSLHSRRSHVLKQLKSGEVFAFFPWTTTEGAFAMASADRDCANRRFLR